MRQPGFERLAEDIDPLRELHAVDAELQIGVVAADMDLAERILSDAGRLQQHLVERGVVALSLGFDRLPIELIDRRAEAWLDLAASEIERLGDDIDLKLGAGRCIDVGRGRRLGELKGPFRIPGHGGDGRGRKQAKRRDGAPSEMPAHRWASAAA